MSNRSSPKKHCLVGLKRPVKSVRRKANKATASERQVIRQQAIHAALSHLQ